MLLTGIFTNSYELGKSKKCILHNTIHSIIKESRIRFSINILQVNIKNTLICILILFNNIF